MATFTASTTHLTNVISCHALSPDGNLLAVCPNSTQVILLERSGGSWRVITKLEGHDQVVSGLDFAEDGAGRLRLVSASHDRNSYVWTRLPPGSDPGPAASSNGNSNGSSSSDWQPELVITKLARAGLCVQWAPGGGKFAIGSGEKAVCVCFYDAERELWAPKLIKKQHGSSVTAVAWHPSGAVLATGSTDGRCRVLNALIPDVDDGAVPAALGGSRFGEPLLEAEGGGWVLAVGWSPSGDNLAFCCQNSILTLLTGLSLAEPSLAAAAAEGSAQRQVLQLPGLPLKCLAFLSDSVLVAGGFDFRPLLFRRGADGQWRELALQPGTSGGVNGGSTLPAKSSSLSARIKMFEEQVAKPQPGASKAALVNSNGATAAGGSSSSGQPHSNCITSITPVPGTSAEGGLRFMTSGLDGKLVEWDVAPEGL